DADQRGFPCLHSCDLLRRESLASGALKRELRVQVLAHQAMLDLAGLTEQVDKLFPAPHLQRRLRGHRGLASIPSLLRSSSKMPGTATPHRAAGNLRGSKSSCTLPERWHMLAIETPPAVSAHRAPQPARQPPASSLR